MRKIVDQFYSI